MRLILVLVLLAATASAASQSAPTLPFEALSEECGTLVLGPNLRATAAGAQLEACSVAQEGEMSALCEGSTCTLYAVGSAEAHGGALPGLDAVKLSIQTPLLPAARMCEERFLGEAATCAGASFVVLPVGVGACTQVHVVSWLEQDQPLPGGDWRTSVASAYAASSATLCRTQDGASLSAP